MEYIFIKMNKTFTSKLAKLHNFNVENTTAMVTDVEDFENMSTIFETTSDQSETETGIFITASKLIITSEDQIIDDEEDFVNAIHPASDIKDHIFDLDYIADKGVCPDNNLFGNTSNQKFSTRNLFGQLTKLNNFIIKQETNEHAYTTNSLLEFDKHDQLISRSESENRIFVILATIGFVCCFTFSCLVIVSFKNFGNNIETIAVEIPVQFKQPYLDAILKNGSVFSSHYNNTHFLSFEYKFSLPIADYYYSFESNQELAYIHGRSQENHMFETFYNIHGFKRQKKHNFIKRDDGDPYHNDIGYNNSISQVGEHLMIFGGGKNDASGLIANQEEFNYLSEYENITNLSQTVAVVYI